MSRKPTTATELEAGALTAWTPAQQAALYALHVSKQAEKDEDEAKRAESEKKRKEMMGGTDVKPEAVVAGKVLDDALKYWSPPLVTFLEKFGQPHRIFIAVVGLHLLFAYSAPWYLRFLLPYPMIYGLPTFCSLSSIYSGEHRALWQAYWIELSLIEYIELLMFRDNVRSLIWLPAFKTVFCIALYSVVERETSDPRLPPTLVYGAIKLIKPFLPELPKPENADTKDDPKAGESSSRSGGASGSSGGGSSRSSRPS